MQYDERNTKDPSMSQIVKLAKSKEGRQLYDLLRETQPETVNNAMHSAATGNYDEVKSAMSSLLANPEIRELLKKLGEK